MFTKKCSLIIPTYNRPKFVRKIFKQLKSLKITFQEILVIDSSNENNKKIVENICQINHAKYFHTNPSVALQRNYGLKLRNKKNLYVMFLDDDIFFYKKSFFHMNQMLISSKNNDYLCGYGFNLITKNSSNNIFEKIKKSFFSKFLNLYSDEPGSVMGSGWHTKIENLKNDKIVEWIYSAAVIYKTALINKKFFDINLGIYSYLEDLDFSLNLKKNKKIKFIICHLAKFKHPNVIERNDYKFGLLEIINRHYIVKKHRLNIISFYLGAVLRCLISFFFIFKGNINFISRFIGNLFGIIYCLFISKVKK
jgi:glycosyltransferase involved in cell wall biosynthesis